MNIDQGETNNEVQILWRWFTYLDSTRVCICLMPFLHSLPKFGHKYLYFPLLTLGGKKTCFVTLCLNSRQISSEVIHRLIL